MERTLLVNGKGNKQRYTFFTEDTEKVLNNYLFLRKTITNDSQYVFLSYKGTKITPRGVEKMLSSLGKKIGISLHPHLLRHTFATELLDEGGDLQLVQELLGHSNLSTTQIYTHISDQKLQENYKKYHPQNQKLPRKK
jgi:integrase/recombinase XerC